MTDLKAKLDALSAKAIDGNWMAPPRSSVVGCGIVSAPQGRVVGSGIDADTTAFITELVNAYRSGQLIVAPVWQRIETCPKDGTRVILAKIVGHPDHETAALSPIGYHEAPTSICPPHAPDALQETVEALEGVLDAIGQLRPEPYEAPGDGALPFARYTLARLRRAAALSELAVGDADLIGENDGTATCRASG